MSTSAACPYPISCHDPPHSPTRARRQSKSQSVFTGRNSISSRGDRTHSSCHEEIISPARIMKPSCRAPGPTNHVLVPQKEYHEEPKKTRPYYMDEHFRLPPITFQSVGIAEFGVRVGKITEKCHPTILGGTDKVFPPGDREIRYWVIVCSFIACGEKEALILLFPVAWV